MIENKNLRSYLLVFLYGCAMCFLYAIALTYDNDVRQLLERAHLLTSKGVVLPYGSVASSGVKVFTPGSLLALLVGLPMLIWNSPFAALILIVILHLFAALMLRNVLRSEFNENVAFLYFLFFWCLPWRTMETNLWNPAYLYFFTALHFWSAYKIFAASSERTRFVFSAIHVLSLFGAMQIHASFVILGFVSLFLLFSKTAKISWSGVLAGAALGLTTLIPYFLERLHNPEFFRSDASSTGFPFRGLIYVYPFVKGLMYWFRQGSFFFPSNGFTETHFSWLQNSQLETTAGIIWKLVTGFFAAVTLYFSAKASWFLYKSKRFTFTEKYCGFMFLGLALAAAIVPAELSFWHTILVFPIALIAPILYLQNRFEVSQSWRSWRTRILAISLVYFGFFTFFSAWESKYHRYPSNLDSKYEELKKEIDSRQ